MRSVCSIRGSAIITGFVAFSLAAEGAANRTFVSTAGTDSNISLNCGATSPCRTFGAALAVTNSGGEIVVLTSGGYGPASITQAVTITAIGVDASVTATSGTDGIGINAAGSVTIRGLSIYGGGTGNMGINADATGFVRLYNVTVDGFLGFGVSFGGAGSGGLAVYDSYLSENGDAGLNFYGTGNGYVKNTVFDHNKYDGFSQTSGTVVIEDSAAVANGGAGFLISGGTLSLIRDDAVQNAIGISSSLGNTQFSYCNITQNTLYAIEVVGGTVAGSSPGTSTVSGSVSGSLAAAVSLQ